MDKSIGGTLRKPVGWAECEAYRNVLPCRALTSSLVVGSWKGVPSVDHHGYTLESSPRREVGDTIRRPRSPNDSKWRLEKEEFEKFGEK